MRRSLVIAGFVAFLLGSASSVQAQCGPFGCGAGFARPRIFFHQPAFRYYQYPTPQVTYYVPAAPAVAPAPAPAPAPAAKPAPACEDHCDCRCGCEKCHCRKKTTALPAAKPTDPRALSLSR